MLIAFSRTFLAPVKFCITVRCLSNAEVSTALRPFFFLVHPDLFGKYPNEQSENEVNLKTLKNYVDMMAEGKKRPNPSDVRFFVRPKAGTGGARHLAKVKIRLSAPTLRETLLSILKGAELPTDFVDSVPVSDVEAKGGSGSSEEEYTDEFHVQPEEGTGFSPTDKAQPFLTWLKANVGVARKRLTACEPVRLEIERLQGSICYEYQLEDILWDCGWETAHRRGTVQAFKALVEGYPEVQPIVRGRTIVFGKDSGVALAGQIVLYSGEVRNNWLNVVKTAPKAEKLLATMPLNEKALSMALRGIRVQSNPGQIVMIEDYRTRLRKLVTSLGDFRTRKNFPTSWPEDMSNYQISVEGDSSALMLSPDGVFVLPSSTPGFLIVEFLTGGLEEASRRMNEARSVKSEEANLIFRCINELGLIQLDRDDMISPQQMISCCSSLLKAASRIRYLTHGNHLVVARYYMVRSDGVICIPWDLVLDLLPGEGEPTKQEEHQPVLHLTMY